MVGTMLPIGYGERQQARFSKSLLSYALGSVLGASGFGLLVGVLGALVPSFGLERIRVATAVTGVVAILFGLSDASLLRMPKPQSRRQVPFSWYRRFRPAIAGLVYGIGLGVGVATRVSVLTFYILPVWGFLTGEVGRSAAILSVFGIGRFLPLFLIDGRRGGDGEALESLISRIEELESLGVFCNGLVLSFVGGYLLAAAHV